MQIGQTPARVANDLDLDLSILANLSSSPHLANCRPPTQKRPARKLAPN